MKKTIYLYILKEILPISWIGLMVFTFMLLMEKVLKLIELIVSRGVDISLILRLLLFISPSFLIFTIPTAVLLGTLLAFGRLSTDSEVTAFKASGISLYQLFFPVCIYSVLACALTAFLVFYGLPWGNRGFKATLYLIAQSKADIEIKERVFNDAFDGLVVYVDKIPIHGKQMEGILIYDERDKGKVNTIFAREGYVVTNPKSQEVILRLFSGDIHRIDSLGKVYQKLQFNAYDLRLELTKVYSTIAARLKDREMSIDEIEEKIEKLKQAGGNTTSLRVELHKRYAFPFTCIIFGLIGTPLGIQPRRSGRSYGFIFSILILLGYYVSLMTSEILAVRQTIPPFLAGWAPNFLFGGLGIYLLIRAANESPFKLSVWLIDGLERLQQKWKGMVDDA